MLHHHDDKPTVPMDYRPPSYEAHTAECAHEDDTCQRGEGSGPFLVALATVTLVIAGIALWAAFY